MCDQGSVPRNDYVMPYPEPALQLHEWHRSQAEGGTRGGSRVALPKLGEIVGADTRKLCQCKLDGSKIVRGAAHPGFQDDRWATLTGASQEKTAVAHINQSLLISQLCTLPQDDPTGGERIRLDGSLHGIQVRPEGADLRAVSAHCTYPCFQTSLRDGEQVRLT
jgi:hypothetical protein